MVPALDHHRHRLGSDRGFLVVARTALDQPPHALAVAAWWLLFLVIVPAAYRSGELQP